VRQFAMAPFLPRAPAALDVPVAEGTRVVVDPAVRFHGSRLISGGSPWQLLRTSSASYELVASWRDGGVVRSHQGSFARTLISRGFVRPVVTPSTSLDDVDVVIPVKDDVTGLARLLPQCHDIFVTVVDDGSVDRDHIERVVAASGARSVRLATNEGPAAARNLGLATTSRPFVCFADADVEIDNALDVLGRLRGHFCDPQVAAVGARVRGASGPRERDRFEHACGALDLGARSGLVTPHAAVAYLPAACLMVRRDAIGEGFDPSMRLGEDVDLIWRLVESGWLVIYDADAVVAHRARRTWRQWTAQRVGYGRSAADLKARHPEHLETVRVDMWTLATWAALLFGRLRVALAVAASARRSLITQLPEVTDDPSAVANELVVSGIARAGVPLARALTRSYAPVLLMALFVPRLRRPALLILIVGTLGRLRHSGRIDVRDIPISLADDVAYSVGLGAGAIERRRFDTLAPRITGSSAGFRAALSGAIGRSPRR